MKLIINFKISETNYLAKFKIGQILSSNFEKKAWALFDA